MACLASRLRFTVFEVVRSRIASRESLQPEIIARFRSAHIRAGEDLCRISGFNIVRCILLNLNDRIWQTCRRKVLICRGSWSAGLPDTAAARFFGNSSSMTANQVRKARDQAPFRPFTICLFDQRRFPIRHADFLWVVPGDRTIGVADERGAVELIDLLHVSSLSIEGSEGVDA